MKIRSIEILENDNNKKGDLFGRLMSDLFHTLGYSEPRLNIHKTGREIDIKAEHRAENKIAFAECKAHKEKIGGSEINKFVGVLDSERRKINKNNSTKNTIVVGYFISLSGFKESAIEQEEELDNSRVVLLKQDKIIQELINGKILISLEEAILYIDPLKRDLHIQENVELLAFDKGWVWVFYFSNNGGQTTTHFTLIHAEGNLLVPQLVEEIIQLDGLKSNLFDNLIYIQSIPSKNRLDEVLINEVRDKYFEYLDNELGEIQFEGLPTDKESGSTKVQLEDIFIPMHFNKIGIESKQEPDINRAFFFEDTGKEMNNIESINRENIGDLFSENSKIAILGRPGSGKSTLLKRIAISYAFPERRKLISDSLPDNNWFPIFFRCRELSEKVTWSITDIIHSIPARAEIGTCKEEFKLIVSKSLQAGNALLLVDGLDEIADDRDRVTFVNQLRTFLATFPSINILITSREAGFRAVGGALSAYCNHYRVSRLSESEIEDLSIKWHIAIIDNSENTIREAKNLASLIINDNRIKVLAQNPLLLTTLLFVRRWAGYLPTKKNVLYQEMIKLLLVTWNVQGHEQLEIEETEPQLCYVAYWMTLNGKQTIDEESLRNCLIEARRQMPEILSYSRISPQEFIKRVESRSSLLIMSGHKKLKNGLFIQIYEFLHLSFQEFLTAKAIVKGYLPREDEEKDKIELIKPHIHSENWKEVIPIVAVLLERDAKFIIEYLIKELENINIENDLMVDADNILVPILLGNCLAYEVQINPVLLYKALDVFAKSDILFHASNLNENILNSKFGDSFRDQTQMLFFKDYNDIYFVNLASTLSDIYVIDNKLRDPHKLLDKAFSDIKSLDRNYMCLGVLAIMNLSFEISSLETMLSDTRLKRYNDIYSFLSDEKYLIDKHLLFSIAWSIVWASEAGYFPKSLQQLYCENLVKALFINIDQKNLSRIICWALTKLLDTSIVKDNIVLIKEINKKVFTQNPNKSNEHYDFTMLYLKYIIGLKINKNNADKIFQKQSSSNRVSKKSNQNVVNLATALGIDTKIISSDPFDL